MDYSISGAHHARNFEKIVADCVAHIDLVEVFCREVPKALQNLKTGLRQVPSKHGWRFQVTDKSPAFLAWLADVQERSWEGPPIQRLYLYRSEVAAEFVTRDYEKADRLHTLAARWLNLKWPGKNKINRFRETTYWCRPGSGRNLAVYSDRPSKVMGTPACRVEIRLTGSAGRVLIPTVRELLQVNPRHLFARCITDGPLELIQRIPERLY